MNVVLVCLDSFRADCLAAAGRSPFIQTPNLDRLAAQGVLFENAFGEALPTIPYRMALCTGMRSFPWKGGFDTRGMWPQGAGWHRIPSRQPTMAELLAEVGYTTGLIADTYHMFKATMNFTRGMTAWDFIRGQETDPYRVGNVNNIDMSKWVSPGETRGPRLVQQYLLNVQDRKCEEDYLPAKVFNGAAQFIRDVKDSQPFFLWVDCFDPHEPFDPPKRFADLYDPDWDEEWEPLIGIGPEHDEKTRRRFVARYHGSCTFVDMLFGRLMDELDRQGVAEDTWVIVVSDHGLETGDHGGYHKGVHNGRYRHNTEMLCLMRLPGSAHAGKRVSGFVQNHDFLPSVLKQCGVAHPPVEGMDIMPLIEGKTETLRDHIVIGWSDHANVRTHDFSYGCFVNKEEREEWLFDLKADPKEDGDIAKERPEVCDTYRGKLEKFFAEYDLKMPVEIPAHEHKTLPPIHYWIHESPAGKALQAQWDKGKTGK
jgi:arylsulfatase A-like enzyme